MSTIAAALAAARQHIPPAEARLLLTEASGFSPAWLVAHDTDELQPAVEAKFTDWVQRRAAGEPVAYLIGWREFYGQRFQVAPGVLIPRPETELLVELGLDSVANIQNPRILDLGTGSGCIAISLALARPDATVYALDYARAALNIAAANARQLNAVVHFTQGNWASALQSNSFDLIVSNPPYIAPDDQHLDQGDLRFEPRSALAAAENGLADLEIIVAAATHLLKRQGRLLCEHGYDQAATMKQLLEKQQFNVDQHLDLAQIVRVSGGTLAQPSKTNHNPV